MKKKLLLLSAFALIFSVFNSRAVEDTNLFLESGFETTTLKPVDKDGTALCYIIDGDNSAWKYETEPTADGSYFVGIDQETSKKESVAYDSLDPKTEHTGRYMFCNHTTNFYQTINLQPGKYALSFKVARMWGAGTIEPHIVVSKDGVEMLNESYFSATNAALFKTYSYILDVTEVGDYKFTFGNSNKCFLFYDDFSLTTSDGNLVKDPADIGVSIGNPKDFKWLEAGVEKTVLTKGNSYNASIAYDAGNDDKDDFIVDSVSVVINELDTAANTVVDNGNNILVTLKTSDFANTKSGSIDIDVAIPTSMTSSIDLPEGHIYQMYITIANNQAQTASYTIDELKGLIILADGETALSSAKQDVNAIFTKDGVVYIISDIEKMVDIYSISGSLVKEVEIYSGKNAITGLSEGLYIINNQKVKVGF